MIETIDSDYSEFQTSELTLLFQRALFRDLNVNIVADQLCKKHENQCLILVII